MDELEFENHIEKMKHRYEEGDYKTGAQIASRIDWRKVKDIKLLNFVADNYEKAGYLDEAREILMHAYKVAPIKNRLFYALCNINIKCRDYKKAREFYIDFCDTFKDDNRKQLLKYNFLKAKGADNTQLIRLLEDYVAEEKEESLMYELAILYEKEKMVDKIIETCDYVVQFFGIHKDGYGKKLLKIKEKYVPLTVEERRLLDTSFEEEKSLLQNKMSYNQVEAQFKNDEIKDEKKTNLKEFENKEENKKIEKLYEEETVDTILDESKINNEIKTVYKANQENYFEDREVTKAFLNEGNEKEKNLKNIIARLKEEEQKDIEKNEKRKETFRKENEEKISKSFDRKESFKRKERYKNMRIEDSKINMIIESYTIDEGIKIAKEELTYIHHIIGTKANICKVSAFNINEKGFVSYIDKINGRDLIIENAGRLNEKQQESIEEYIANSKHTNIFALVDTINKYDSIALANPDFIQKFDVYSVLSELPKETLVVDNIGKVVATVNTKREEEKEIKENYKENNKENDKEYKEDKEERENTKHKEEKEEKNIKNNKNIKEKKVEQQQKKIEPFKVKIMDVDEFVEYCKEYASNIDCVIQGKTMPVLYEIVEDMKEQGIALTERVAIDFIEDAADRAEKPKLFKRSKYTKEGLLILEEEHFEE